MRAITEPNQMVTGQKLELEDNQRNTFRRHAFLTSGIIQMELLMEDLLYMEVYGYHSNHRGGNISCTNSLY
jgi:hypothetical protein